MNKLVPIKLSIIDDSDSYRNYLKSLIQDDSRIHLYGEYNSPIAFIAQLNSPFQPDVCLVDLVMPEMSGLDCAQIIKTKCPKIHVIIVTSFPTKESIEIAKMLGAGYIQKGTIGENFMKHIITNTQIKDVFFLSVSKEYEEKHKYFIDFIHKVGAIQKNVSLLSETQRKVLQMRKENKSVEEIAEILNTSTNTVKTHIFRAMTKLDIPNILDYIQLDDNNNP